MPQWHLLLLLAVTPGVCDLPLAFPPSTLLPPVLFPILCFTFPQFPQTFLSFLTCIFALNNANQILNVKLTLHLGSQVYSASFPDPVGNFIHTVFSKGIWLNNIFSLPPFPPLPLSSWNPSIQEQLASVTKAEGGKIKENKLMVER